MKHYYVYILTNTSTSKKTLYIGVTNNIERRMYEHKKKLVAGFSSKYNLNKLVYVEVTIHPVWFNTHPHLKLPFWEFEGPPL